MSAVFEEFIEYVKIGNLQKVIKLMHPRKIMMQLFGLLLVDI